MSGNQSCSKFSRKFSDFQAEKSHRSVVETRRGSKYSSWCHFWEKVFQHLAEMCCATLRFFILFRGGLKIAWATLQGGFICGRTQSGQVWTSSSPLPWGPTLLLHFPPFDSQSFNKTVWQQRRGKKSTFHWSWTFPRIRHPSLTLSTIFPIDLFCYFYKEFRP